MTDPAPASLPAPPYYAVVFTAVRTAGDNGCAETNEQMMKLAADQPGFLGVDSARGAKRQKDRLPGTRHQPSMRPAHYG